MYPLKKTRRYIIDWSDLFITENEYDYEKHNGLDHNHCVDVYIIFTDPLERQYDLVQIVMAWYLVTLLLDFLFRHNNTYGVIRNVIATVLLCVLYFVFP